MPKLFAPDPGLTGMYSIGVGSGNIAATLATLAPLFSFRWSHATNLCVLDTVKVGVTVSGVITTSVSTGLELIVARSFTASDTGGTTITLTTNNAKFRTTFATSLVGDARIATTGTLTAGTRTLDAQAMARLPYVSGTAIGTSLALTTIYDRLDLFPIVFAQDEGFLIRSAEAGPATGTFIVHVYCRWIETVPQLIV